MPAQKISVHIFDPNQLFREGLKQLLRKCRLTVSAEGKSLAEAFDESCLPDLILCTLDADAPSELTKIANIRSRYPTVKIVALTSSVEDGSAASSSAPYASS